MNRMRGCGCLVRVGSENLRIAIQAGIATFEGVGFLLPFLLSLGPLMRLCCSLEVRGPFESDLGGR
ncbi:hypothetical protein SISSUDRAFT_1043382 [Sistotremastrum suecicum HHB10207 ss-3]|uniref:Uncharacterized protein n=1 Tax=Sistotremastrum suecicum HHB10207 ss-3 TaxID=1314776 RepID=A0A166FWS6_9AGAM|nr:hypothetical protein SISSUDRAFT_1043382 [Sistotremastrum suecicum HHB10207 ss-3]